MMVDVTKKGLETIKLPLIINPPITEKCLSCDLNQKRQQQQQTILASTEKLNEPISNDVLNNR